jgi:VanZ family protein
VIERDLARSALADERVTRLMTVPGIDMVSPSAPTKLVRNITEPTNCACLRDRTLGSRLAPSNRAKVTCTGLILASRRSNDMPTAGSPIDARSPGSKVARIAAWGLAVAIVILSLVPAALRPETSVPHGLEHLLIYAATGFAFGLGYKRRHDLLAVFLVIASGIIEIAQLFVPGRHARLSDLVIDAVAACIGLVTSSLIVGRVRA